MDWLWLICYDWVGCEEMAMAWAGAMVAMDGLSWGYGCCGSMAGCGSMAFYGSLCLTVALWLWLSCYGSMAA